MRLPKGVKPDIPAGHADSIPINLSPSVMAEELTFDTILRPIVLGR